VRHVLRVALAICLPVAAAGPLPAGDPAEVRQILDRAIKATGGAAKVSRLRAVSWQGSATFAEPGGNEIALKFEGSAQGWDQYRLEAEAQENGQTVKLLLVVNGAKAWALERGVVKEAPKDEIGPVRDFLYGLRAVQMLPALKGKGVGLSHLGELKVADRAAVGLAVSQNGRPEVHLFFDKANGLPLKSSVRLKLPDGREKELEFLFADYKDFDGLRHFTKVTVRLDERDTVAELSEVRPLGELDASAFARP
jgi:hypothetical protein